MQSACCRLQTYYAYSIYAVFVWREIKFLLVVEHYKLVKHWLPMWLWKPKVITSTFSHVAQYLLAMLFSRHLVSRLLKHWMGAKSAKKIVFWILFYENRGFNLIKTNKSAIIFLQSLSYIMVCNSSVRFSHCKKLCHVRWKIVNIKKLVLHSLVNYKMPLQSLSHCSLLFAVLLPFLPRIASKFFFAFQVLLF